MNDPTEQARRQLIPEMPAELQAELERGKPVWSTDQMTAEFEVLGFSAPFVVVRKRGTGERGSLMFTHRPRFYFGWEPDNK